MINNLDSNIDNLIEMSYEEYCKKKFESLDKKKKAELYALQKSQLELLDHASKFPNVLRISYSTCSIYEVENEQVVKLFLESHPNFELVNLEKYSETKGFSTNFSEGYKCLRADPRESGMDGFFVSIFKRRKN